MSLKSKSLEVVTKFPEVLKELKVLMLSFYYVSQTLPWFYILMCYMQSNYIEMISCFRNLAMLYVTIGIISDPALMVGRGPKYIKYDMY